MSQNSPPTAWLTVTADGSALVFAETQARKLSKYWLTGPDKGTVTELAVHLSGLPDNIKDQMDDKLTVRMEAIISSMTPKERAHPDLIKGSRKRRIAAGAGVQVQDVNRMLNQFEQMRDMMKKMKGGGMMKMMRRMGAGMKGMVTVKAYDYQPEVVEALEKAGLERVGEFALLTRDYWLRAKTPKRLSLETGVLNPLAKPAINLNKIKST